MNATKAVRKTFAALLVLFILAAAALFAVQREDRVDLLFAVNGDDFDQAAYDNFRQTLAANVEVRKLPLSGLSERELERYDAVYLDYNLKQSDTVRASRDKLVRYVEQGGHLFLENDFADDFPPEFLGASQVVDIPTPQNIQLEYPEADLHLQGLQQVFKLFVDSFSSQNAMSDDVDGQARLNTLPGYDWGKGLMPSTAQTLVRLNQVSVMSANRYGQGSVLLSSALLPTHYYITGFDLQSGMDPAKGFPDKVGQSASGFRPEPGTAYFRFKNEQPLEAYFHFGFAAANYQLRNEFLAYVSKEKLGYSLTKVHGPYGRPAMAYQNHFEVASAIKNEEGIQWTELLKQYNQIPSFSLVRGAYEWNRWYESVTVHLNAGSQARPAFTGAYANSFYGSGVRLVGGGQPLALAEYPEPKQLSWPIGDPYRAYPTFGDLNGDGLPDLIAGSADGTLNLFANLGRQDGAYANQPLPEGTAVPDAFGVKEALLTSDGKPLRVSGYAAPAAADLNGDGAVDLVIGDKDGRLWLALNGGSGRFAQPVPVTAGGRSILAGTGVGDASGSAYAAPHIADYDGDGTPDLVVGAGDGSVWGCRGVPGTGLRFEGARRLMAHSARFAAPSVRDMNGDGRPDLVIGSEDGDLQVYLRDTDGSYAKQGPVSGETANQMGSKALVGGHNSVPLWYDINHDGKDDLIAGQLEFARPIPLDDPSFPYKDKLKAFIAYAKDNKLELYPHLFFHSHLSAEEEKREIGLHRQMFDHLGIPWTVTGTNQHTWRVNNDDRLQTLRSESAADIWFNFGFRPPDNPQDPQYGQDYVWGMPFLLNAADLKRPMVLHTPSYILRLNGQAYASEAIYDAYAKLDMPIDYFDHIEYKFPDRTQELLAYVRYLDKLRSDYDYNFMTETQMARSFLTTLTAKVTVKQSYGMYVWNKLKDRIGSGKHLTLTLKTDTAGVPEELAAEYKDTLGVAIEPGRPYAGQPLRVDAGIYTVRNGTLYTGLQQPTRLTVDWSPEPLHLIRSNVPCKLTQKEGVTTVELLAEGLQQIKVYSPAPLQISGGGELKIDRNETDGTYTVTRYGDRTSIRLEAIR